MRRNDQPTHWILALAILAACTVPAAAQRSGFGGGPGGFWRGLAGGANAPVFALRDDVRRDLALSDGQTAEIREIAERTQRESRDVMRQLFQNFRELTDEQRREARDQTQEEIDRIQQQARGELTASLTPVQRQRFRELEFQFHLSHGNAPAALAAAGASLTDDQVQKLDDAMRQARIQLGVRMAELSREMFAGALTSVVDPRDVQRWTGEVFDFAAPAPGDLRNAFRGPRRRNDDNVRRPRPDGSRPGGQNESDDDSPQNRRRRRR